MRKLIFPLVFLMMDNAIAQNKQNQPQVNTKQNNSVIGTTRTYTTVTATAPGNFNLAGNPSVESIAPARLHIFPKWTTGDRDFGFEVFPQYVNSSATVSVYISPGGGQLIAKIFCGFSENQIRANAETKTEAVINEERVLAYAPSNRIFSRILSKTSSALPAYYRNNDYEKNDVVPNIVDGPVKMFGVNDQTDGNDVGNNTSDDSFLDIIFNSIEVETKDLPSGIKELSLPLNLVTDNLRRALVGTTIRINNFGPCGGGTCFKNNDCFVKFPDAILPDTLRFAIPEIYTDARHYYFNDINLHHVGCRAEGNYLKIELFFESDGAELVGKCANDLGSYDAGCGFGTPSAQLNDLKITLALRLVAKDGKLSYEPLDIQPEISSNFSADCGILSWLCGEIFKDAYQSGVYNLASIDLRNAFANPETNGKIANSLTPKMLEVINGLRPSATPASTIVDVSIQDRNALIRYR